VSTFRGVVRDYRKRVIDMPDLGYQFRGLRQGNRGIDGEDRQQIVISARGDVSVGSIFHISRANLRLTRKTHELVPTAKRLRGCDQPATYRQGCSSRMHAMHRSIGGSGGTRPPFRGFATSGTLFSLPMSTIRVWHVADVRACMGRTLRISLPVGPLGGASFTPHSAAPATLDFSMVVNP
jgi:hypothetical protein